MLATTLLGTHASGHGLAAFVHRNVQIHLLHLALYALFDLLLGLLVRFDSGPLLISRFRIFLFPFQLFKNGLESHSGVISLRTLPFLEQIDRLHG